MPPAWKSEVHRHGLQLLAGQGKRATARQDSHATFGTPTAKHRIARIILNLLACWLLTRDKCSCGRATSPDVLVIPAAITASLVQQECQTGFRRTVRQSEGRDVVGAVAEQELVEEILCMVTASA